MNIFHEEWLSIDDVEIACTNTRDEIESHSFSELIDRVLSTYLNERERVIIKERFWNERTNKEIGQKFNITGARVSDIERKALWKLRRRRNPSLSAPLKEWDEFTDSWVQEWEKKEEEEFLKRQEERLEQELERKKRNEEDRARRERIRIAEQERMERARQEALVAREAQEKRDREIREKLLGNGVPYGIFLSVTKEPAGHIVYSLIALPGRESILENAAPETRGTWIKLLIERAQWLASYQ